MNPLTFSFDIGYASIGWSVIEASQDAFPQVIGTGVVLFPSDDCLASERRENRRMRRTIRARRARIERMGRILEHYGVITPEERMMPGAPLPFLLAARALRGLAVLSPLELWNVLRWYAHNRGYDGNSSWSSQEDAEETKRVKIANEMMAEKGTKTMAETVCAILELDPADPAAHIRMAEMKSPNYKRDCQMAFPRTVVEREVRAICESCTCLPDTVRALILDEVGPRREALKEAGVQLPLRYIGSVLFGQLRPRFDNRIIERCPITWAQVYKQALEKETPGTPEQNMARAKKEADKLAKVPKADCREFYEYRFARILANIRAADAPLSAEQRAALWKRAQKKRRFTKAEFIEAVEELVAGAPHNLRNYFQIVPESEKALIFHPMKDEDKASGRAPYARPVLRQVVAEVLRGEDPTRPAASPEHPEGESKAADGILYCLQDPESEVNIIQAQRSIDEQTNNPLVRHRLLIFERLLRDMVKKYAAGDASRVARCVVEVAREVRTYAGKGSTEIEKEENLKLKGFHDAVKYLQKVKKEAPECKLTINAKLIKKCRIAMDMNWRCPYTGKEYSACDLPGMDLEHIIPYSARETNALSALTLTWPEVNKMKGDRTGLEFIKQYGGQAVAGKDNLSIRTIKDYKEWVKELKPQKPRNGDKKLSDDDKRRRLRKRLFLVEKKPSKTEKGFTLGQLTQSSQLMRMAAQTAKRHIPQAKVAMIPGRITAETRKAWKLMGILGHPNLVPEINEEMDKESIRSITHLHHAIDACTLGLIPLLIPGGTNGAVWAAMLKRRIPTAQADELRTQSKLFAFSNKDGMAQLHLRDLPESVKDSISRALQEKRVVQHIPADMSGAKLDTQYKGIIKIKDREVYLRQRDSKKDKIENKDLPVVIISGSESKIYHDTDDCKTTIKSLKKEKPNQRITILKKSTLIHIPCHNDPKRNGIWRVVGIEGNAEQDILLELSRSEGVDDGTRNWQGVGLNTLIQSGMEVASCVKASAIAGLNSAKLQKIKAALETNKNFGIAIIGNKMEVIRHIAVYKTLSRLRKENPGQKMTVLKKGMLIRLSHQKTKITKDGGEIDRNGIWRVVGITDDAKQGVLLDLSRPERISNRDWNWRNVRILTLIRTGMEIVPTSYIGS
ncbi:MAG: hypothetical protein J1E42_06195 [Akkermansiaceae bacterium]|nr:hypothetical protein [Akkermansiaceae bacterium]